MMNRPEAIALRDEAGIVRAWACPRCHRVSVSVSCGGANGRTVEAEFSREAALKCGICQGCGVETECHRYSRLCETCQAAETARGDAHFEAHREEWAQLDEARRGNRRQHLDTLLSDLPLLAARDWTDDEETAAELLPLILDRLTALQIALFRYGQHRKECAVYGADSMAENDCTCGFQDALNDNLARVDRQPDATVAVPQPTSDGHPD